MKNNRRILPSLDGLVFFESAARHNSFTRAAEELHVTQAAVSKRIRELEMRLDTRLFLRSGRKLALTGAGQQLFERSGAALEFIEDACRKIRGEEWSRVSVAANSAVSLFWLAPKIRAFSLGEQSCSVNVFTSDNPGDTLQPENDLVVVYGYGDSPGWDCELLFHEVLVPVASPEYLSAQGLTQGASSDGAGNPCGALVLLEYDRLGPDWINWQRWIEATGEHRWQRAGFRQCRSYAHAIGEAIKGQGVALGSRGLIDDELAAGSLRVIGDVELTSGRGYFLATPQQRVVSMPAKALRKLLLASIAPTPN